MLSKLLLKHYRIDFLKTLGMNLLGVTFNSLKQFSGSPSTGTGSLFVTCIMLFGRGGEGRCFVEVNRNILFGWIYMLLELFSLLLRLLVLHTFATDTY